MADRYDLVIVGMGSGGMVAAEFAATLDLRVAVVERGRVGGDCLWTGCVPSKALTGLREGGPPHADGRRLRHRAGRAGRRPGQGVGPDPVRAGPDRPERRQPRPFPRPGPRPGRRPRAADRPEHGRGRRRTPARDPLRPALHRQPPGHPADRGTGRGGVRDQREPLRAHRTARDLRQHRRRPDRGRDGAGVHPARHPGRAPAEGPAHPPARRARARRPARRQAPSRRASTSASTSRRSGSRSRTARRSSTAPRTAGPRSWAADELLVAVGREPNVENLGLEELGIETGPKGVVVDNRGRTSVETVYASGDVAGRYLFTHSAAYEGVRAVRDMFFPGQGQGRRERPVVHVHRSRARARRA